MEHMTRFFAAVGAYAAIQIDIVERSAEWEIRPPVLTREEAARLMEESIKTLKEILRD